MLDVVTIRDAVGSVRALMRRGFTAREMVPARGALGRVLSCDVVAAGDLPPFDRSTVDGYAVRARDTFGASESMPAYLTLCGDVVMGSMPVRNLEAGSAMRILTGGALPPGADAAAMLEYCEEPGDGDVAVGYSVSPGENVIKRGEDVAAGSVVLRDGHRLRPQELGALEGLGVVEVGVYARPMVGVLSTGDEVVDPCRDPGPGQIRDVNAAALAGSIERDGMTPVFLGVAPDSADELRAILRDALELDAVVISGGSSAGVRDVVAATLDSLGEPGVVVHGLALRPGKPAILAVIGDRLVAGLPGHPASALVAYRTVVSALLRHLGGEDLGDDPVRFALGIPFRARCSRSLASAPGRDEFVRCTVRREGAEAWVDPVLGKSGLISTLTRAEAMIHIPLDAGGVEAGAFVDVYPI
ncbi:MAG: molybdopterin molybdotransferase MoeA [Firmicutes bacterium]|nr:molybdopterin molybdotransferase MoeA [Bacillota bacterium]